MFTSSFSIVNDVLLLFFLLLLLCTFKKLNNNNSNSNSSSINRRKYVKRNRSICSYKLHPVHLCWMALHLWRVKKSNHQVKHLFCFFILYHLHPLKPASSPKHYSSSPKPPTLPIHVCSYTHAPKSNSVTN